MKNRAINVMLVSLMACATLLSAPRKEKKQPEPYQFKLTHKIPHTAVKNQYRTGTCWCFATVSFVESEAMRKGAPELDLSEMFVVRHTYPRKADNYVRLHGTANFEQGGQSHDVMEQIARFGIVTEADYSGMRINEKRHNHGEMVSVLHGMVEGIIKRRGSRVTPRWREAFSAVLDAYLGTPPEKITHDGREMTPVEFARDVVKFDAGEYVELTSYSHHPFWTRVRLQIPDNWTADGNYWNIPMEEMMKVIHHALKNGYSVAWDGDVSEHFFSSRDTGLALAPEKEWDDMTRKERKDKLTQPIAEKTVTQGMRQETFENFTTTDDHLMHIVGLAKDQRGKVFYWTKNSGGTVDRKYGGYVYMSDPYVRLKTICIMVHRDAIPEEIRARFVH